MLKKTKHLPLQARVQAIKHLPLQAQVQAIKHLPLQAQVQAIKHLPLQARFKQSNIYCIFNPTTPTADKNNSSSMSSANSASPQATSKNASGPMDMIKNLFKSFMGGNK